MRRPVATFALFFLGFPIQATAAGPDVIVGDLHQVSSWGSVGDIHAYSVGTISCNIGDADLAWVFNTNEHPVIAQNIYRLHDGRFEQIGMSWLKHGFLALDDELCGTCTGPGGAVLNPGCSDPYGSGLNGNQTRLGPRSEVNPSTGVFAYPHTLPDPEPTLAGRIQVHQDDLDPSMNVGAAYYIEGHYITADDAVAGNALNNASHRLVTVNQVGGGFQVNIPLETDTQREVPAILAWEASDPDVAFQNVDITGDGRLMIAGKATTLGAGLWHYEYALFNLNSDRSLGGFSVELHATAVVVNTGFHDVSYHSGEPYDGADWPASVGAGIVAWSTTDFTTNPNANALRWGTLYNFRFDSNAPPAALNDAPITLTLFKPGSPTQIEIAFVGPSQTPPDCNGNAVPDADEIMGGASDDCDANGVPDECQIDAGSGAPGGPFFCTFGCDTDCNNDGIPDTCQLAGADCNGNLIPDACEIDIASPAPGGPFFCTAGCDADCNINGIPDECDALSGPSLDCNTNLVPDECEIDENSTAPGGPFFCTGGCAPDCNNTGVPDDCELLANDCNINGVPDECDSDCDGDNTPDACESLPCLGITAGDSNCDGTIDELDIPGFVEAIINGLGVCQADMNGDGSVNGLDVSAFAKCVINADCPAP